MNTERTISKLSSAALALSLLALPTVASALSTNVVSDESWQVTDSTGAFVGLAQAVCLNDVAPPNCPATAPRFDYPGVAWAASHPGANWIWVANVDRYSDPAARTFTFTKSFYLCGTPMDGMIHVAADNEATVELNGRVVASATSNDAATDVPVSAADLRSGENVLRITVTNWDAGPDCQFYWCNPAGLVFWAEFSDALHAWPTCTLNGQTIEPPNSFAVSCPAGQEGSASQPCLCSESRAFFGAVNFSGCRVPATCFGERGGTFRVGEREFVSCAPGQNLNGPSLHTCRSDGTWDVALGRCEDPPVPEDFCLAADGTPYRVGEVEALSCSAPYIGTERRTCLAAGQWSPTEWACSLPAVGVGEWCGSSRSSPAVQAECPAGTECVSRRSRVCQGWWIFRTCTWIVSTDWYCQ